MEHDDRSDATGGDPIIGPAGVPFPDEHEWLDTPPPADLTSADFVGRTVRSLEEEGLAVPAADAARGPVLRPEILAAFRAPEPSPDFVERTMAALQKDRRDGFRDLLARHAAPPPSRQFVERTLRALGAERRQRWRRSWTWPIVAIAATALLWAMLRSNDAPAERSLPFDTNRVSPFAHTYAPTRLPGILAAASRRGDPHALADGGADGAWIFVGGTR